MAMHQGRRSRWLAIRPVYWQRQVTISHTCTYIMYLRCEDAILAILCMGLPITTTIAGEWLSSLIFSGNNKCITVNGQTIINVGADNISSYISCDDYSFHTNFGKC